MTPLVKSSTTLRGHGRSARQVIPGHRRPGQIAEWDLNAVEELPLNYWSIPGSQTVDSEVVQQRCCCHVLSSDGVDNDCVKAPQDANPHPVALDECLQCVIFFCAH